MKAYKHFLFLFMYFCVITANQSDFFPFGTSEGDLVLQHGNDEVSNALKLKQPLQFYNTQFSSVYVATNGILCPQPPPSEDQYLTSSFPLSFPAIVPFLADIDTRVGTGAIYYRTEDSVNMLNHVDELIFQGFPGSHFRSTHMFITTWDHVACFNKDSWTEYWESSFQVVLAGNKTDSFALFLYSVDGLQFSGILQNTSTSFADLSVLAGFNRGDRSHTGEMFHAISSSKETTQRLYREGSIDVRGLWIFYIGSSRVPFPRVIHAVGSSHSLAHTLQADSTVNTNTTTTDEDFYILEDHTSFTVKYSSVAHQDAQSPPPGFALTSSFTSLPVSTSRAPGLCGSLLPLCSQDGYCTDYANGSCCHCRSGYYGNGRQCLPQGIPQRMSGKLSGHVLVGSSEVKIEKVDLHGYAVPGEGRVYVSISPVFQQAGWALMAVSPLASMFGWLFALELQSHRNGFSLTGAEFSYLAEMMFYPRKQRLTIAQQAHGIDSVNHLKIEIHIDGELPSIPNFAKVQIQPYKETIQCSPSVITSSALHEYTVVSENGGSEMFSYFVHQNMSFQRCNHGPWTVPDFQQLNVEHAMVIYSSEENILKYMFISTVGPVGGELPGLVEVNPCRSGKHYCDPMALCLPGEGLQYHCQCAMGFRGDGKNCYDVDECTEGLNFCGPHTECVNMPGSHHCYCETGYEFDFDWQVCIDIDECLLQLCHPLASCSNTHGSFHCQCWPGYDGDGFLCQPHTKKEEPTVATCIQHRQKLQEALHYWGEQSLLEAYIPQCDGQGHYKPLQCLSSTGHCWCVNSMGLERMGTRTLPGMDPANCDQPASLVPESLCERWRTVLLSHYGGRPSTQDYMPQCDQNGHFLSIQCYGNSSYCWCVDMQGRELIGTRSYSSVKPACISAKVSPLAESLVYPVVKSSPSGPGLLYAQASQIGVIPLDGTHPVQEKSTVLLSLQGSVVIGISYDCQENTLYWSDVARRSISRVSLVFGAEPDTIIHTDMVQPEGLAVDVVHRRLFWVDSGKDRIEMADLEGQNRRILFDSNIVNPRAIIVDATSRTLFWTDWDCDFPRIERSTLEGHQRAVLVNEGLGLPNALTLDPLTNHLCWADAGTKKLECIAIDGTKRLVINNRLDYPFSLAIYNGHMYYTDWERDGILVINKATNKQTDYVPIQKSNLYGIGVIPLQCF